VDYSHKPSHTSKSDNIFSFATTIENQKLQFVTNANPQTLLALPPLPHRPFSGGRRALQKTRVRPLQLPALRSSRHGYVGHLRRVSRLVCSECAGRMITVDECNRFTGWMAYALFFYSGSCSRPMRKVMAPLFISFFLSFAGNIHHTVPRTAMKALGLGNRRMFAFICFHPNESVCNKRSHKGNPTKATLPLCLRPIPFAIQRNRKTKLSI
jgi:hypothetical protein